MPFKAFGKARRDNESLLKTQTKEGRKQHLLLLKGSIRALGELRMRVEFARQKFENAPDYREALTTELRADMVTVRCFDWISFCILAQLT